MSLLCADIGNGDTVLGLLSDGDVLAHWRVSTIEGRTPDEWAVLLRALLAESGTQTFEELTEVAVCATVPSVLTQWREMLPRYFSTIPHVIVEPGIRTGIGVRMDNPREVGTDRVMNAVAAAQRFTTPVIVVDFGTATTFDVVSESGDYVGGAIASGVELSLQALGRRGAQLREVELRAPRSVIAKNTVEALQSGMVLGTASLVDGMVARMIRALEVPAERVTVVATGPLAGLVATECESFTQHDPWLTLHGLELVFQRNS